MKLSEKNRDQLNLLVIGSIGGLILAGLLYLGHVVNESIGGVTNCAKHTTALVVNKAESSYDSFNAYRDSIKE